MVDWALQINYLSISLSLAPWYYRNGWLGVKKQLPTSLPLSLSIYLSFLILSIVSMTLILKTFRRLVLLVCAVLRHPSGPPVANTVTVTHARIYYLADTSFVWQAILDWPVWSASAMYLFVLVVVQGCSHRIRKFAYLMTLACSTLTTIFDGVTSKGSPYLSGYFWSTLRMTTKYWLNRCEVNFMRIYIFKREIY